MKTLDIVFKNIFSTYPLIAWIQIITEFSSNNPQIKPQYNFLFNHIQHLSFVSRKDHCPKYNFFPSNAEK